MHSDFAEFDGFADDDISPGELNGIFEFYPFDS
jgi:hypothetical protein